MAGYGVKLLHTDSDIMRIINEAAIKKLSGKFYNYKNIDRIRQIVGAFVREAIQHTEVWRSLSGADNSETGLDAHVGLPANKKDAILKRLLDIWVKEIEVRPRKIERRDNSFIMGYDFYAIDANFGEVLSAPEAVVENFSTRSRLGKTPKYIPWLHWLLIAGDQVAIDGYRIRFDDYNLNYSRSGKAIMKIGGHYVLPSFYGPFSKDNNFVCRAMDELTRNNDFKQKIIHIVSNKGGYIDSYLLLKDLSL